MIYAPKVQEASSVCSRARKGEIAFFLVNDSTIAMGFSAGLVIQWHYGAKGAPA